MSFPSGLYQCFRVAVILSPYLGDFWSICSPSAVHPLAQVWFRAPSPLPHPSGPSAPDRLGSLRHRPGLQPEVREVTHRAPFRPPNLLPHYLCVAPAPSAIFALVRVGRSHFGVGLLRAGDRGRGLGGSGGVSAACDWDRFRVTGVCLGGVANGDVDTVGGGWSARILRRGFSSILWDIRKMMSKEEF